MIERMPELLDLYCCQGGASAGYADSGWRVTGVDSVERHRARYMQSGASVFHESDVLEFLSEKKEWIQRTFSAAHASPPCQRYSATQRIMRRDHPDLIAPTRILLEDLGIPFVIENVEDARSELHGPVTMCGASFGLHTYRHRLFETGGGFHLDQPVHHEHVHRSVKMGRPVRQGDFYHAVGHFVGIDYVRSDMGMPWASGEGVREAVPPAYTAYIGRKLMEFCTDMSRTAEDGNEHDGA